MQRPTLITVTILLVRLRDVEDGQCFLQRSERITCGRVLVRDVPVVTHLHQCVRDAAIVHLLPVVHFMTPGVASRVKVLNGRILFEIDPSHTYYKVTIEVPVEAMI